MNIMKIAAVVAFCIPAVAVASPADESGTSTTPGPAVRVEMPATPAAASAGGSQGGIPVEVAGMTTSQQTLSRILLELTQIHLLLAAQAEGRVNK